MNHKPWYRSKTVWVNALTVTIAVLLASVHIVPSSWLPYLMAGTGIMNIFLRLITGQPIDLGR